MKIIHLIILVAPLLLSCANGDNDGETEVCSGQSMDCHWISTGEGIGPLEQPS
jgi:hypothetical protein